MSVHECDNPYCVCHEIGFDEAKRMHFMTPSQIEGKYRAALSRLQMAHRELTYLQEGDYLSAQDSLDELDTLIVRLQAEREQAAAKFGFEVRDGVGPGDWKIK